jgi:orotate phosphoribosyltransferase
MSAADTEREELAALVRELGVVHERVTLSSGAEADYYVDLRRVTLEHRAAPLVGRLLRVLTAVRAVREAGAEVVGVATVVDRDTGAREAIEAEQVPYRALLGLADIGLA